jgi:hypothetical protein
MRARQRGTGHGHPPDSESSVQSVPIRGLMQTRRARSGSATCPKSRAAAPSCCFSDAIRGRRCHANVISHRFTLQQARSGGKIASNLGALNGKGGGLGRITRAAPELSCKSPSDHRLDPC